MIGLPKSRLREWQKKCQKGEGVCAKCGETRRLTVDHIVPIHLIMQLTLDKEMAQEMEENFQILCVYCNKQKNALIDVRNPITYTVLEKLLNHAKNEFLK